jgi:MFS transporter, UMF1 family
VAISLVTAANEPRVLFVAGPLVEVSFGSIGAVSRVMLIALSPPEKIGEFFAFYGLAGRFSAVTGPALTALILTAFGGMGDGAYRLAVLALVLIVGVAVLILVRIPDKRPERVVGAFSG